MTRDEKNREKDDNDEKEERGRTRRGRRRSSSSNEIQEKNVLGKILGIRCDRGNPENQEPTLASFLL